MVATSFRVYGVYVNTRAVFTETGLGPLLQLVVAERFTARQFRFFLSGFSSLVAGFVACFLRPKPRFVI